MRVLVTLIANLVLIGFLMSLIEGGTFSESFNTVLKWAIGFVIANWVFGWVSVLRAEWAFRRPQPVETEELRDDRLEMTEEERERFEERKRALKGRLIRSGQVSEKDLRRAQEELRKQMGG